MEARFIYITCKDKTEALSIGRLLLVENLIACANVIEGMTSIYRWEAKVVEDSEVILIAKSEASKVPELIEKVKTAHSYKIPCVVSLPIKEGNPDYIAWIGDELQIESK
ncbi:MAG: divalent-cation tolerance protein CutA [Bacteroidia bacterium]|nr:divalent-cation tolerance protein CutA [Bacteroidia bacterium]